MRSVSGSLIAGTVRGHGIKPVEVYQVRRFALLVIILVFAGGFAFWATTKPNQKIKREPLQKSGATLKSPTEYLKRERLESGREVVYDPKPRVEVVDANAGKYELRWIGYDGKEKVIAYQRPDAIDAIVSGSVELAPDGNYVYSYILENLPSSPSDVSSFVLQNFSDDTRPIEINGASPNLADLRLLRKLGPVADDGKPRNLENIHIGQMSNQIYRFKEGNWIRVAILSSGDLQVVPGSKLHVKIISKAVPGLVGCSATGGPRTLKGVGEHMPSELEDAIPGYDIWPSGYTVGPVASLNSLSADQRASYILDKMIQFEKLGWITSASRRWYEKNLRTDVDAAQQRARSDLDSEQISSEVFAIIQALK